MARSARAASTRARAAATAGGLSSASATFSLGGKSARWASAPAGVSNATSAPRMIGDLMRSSPGLTPGLRASALAATASIRSEEHTSELQSLMRISYAVFCLKKKITHDYQFTQINHDTI